MDFSFARADVPEQWSYAVAADHLGESAGAGSGPILARDLSGDPLRFGTDDEHRFSVRPMTEGDLGDLQRWLNAEHVVPWWDDRREPEQVAAHYGPAIRGEEATRLWIWEVNGRSVGFAQDYRIAEHPEFALLCGRPDAVGFDYLVGERAFTARGLGTSMLWVFLRDIVMPAYPGVAELFAAPHHRNLASRRVLAKVGATEGLWFDEPTGTGTVETVVGCSIDVAKVMAGLVTPK